MNIEMKSNSTFQTSSTGLPIYRVQFLNVDTGEVVSDVDVITSADCVRYINQNPIIKEGLGFKKGESVDTDLEKIITDLLYPYVKPEFVNIFNTSILPQFSKIINKDEKVYLEKGTTMEKFNLSVEVAAGSKKLVRCSLIRIQNNLRENIQNIQLNIEPGQSKILDFTVPKFTNDIIYLFEISDNENIIESYKLDFEFILPIYVGYVKDGLLDPELPEDELNRYMNGIIELEDRVQKRLVEPNTTQKGFFDIVVDKNCLCPFILVPLKWNSLYKVNDINNMDITKFFMYKHVQIQTSSDNTDYEGYVMYVSKEPADSMAKVRYLRNITYTFADDVNWKDAASDGQQSEIVTGFELLTPGPIDSRFVKESYDDLSYIRKPYPGLIVYIKNINTYYKYNVNGIWEVTNTSVRLFNGKPSDTMGGKMDISIDIATGDIYQKTNSNVWELKGNLKNGGTV